MQPNNTNAADKGGVNMLVGL